MEEATRSVISSSCSTSRSAVRVTPHSGSHLNGPFAFLHVLAPCRSLRLRAFQTTPRCRGPPELVSQKKCGVPHVLVLRGLYGFVQSRILIAPCVFSMCKAAPMDLTEDMYSWKLASKWGRLTTPGGTQVSCVDRKMWTERCGNSVTKCIVVWTRRGL